MSLTPETAKRLRDVLRACREIQEFSTGRVRDDLQTDRAFQLIIERLLELVGEALRQAERFDPSLAERIPDFRDIVGTRNRLIHDYDRINYNLLWDIVEVYVPALQAKVRDCSERPATLTDTAGAACQSVIGATIASRPMRSRSTAPTDEGLYDIFRPESVAEAMRCGSG